MYCILVAGVPASGKSTFAELLSQKINVLVESKDIIKEKLFDTIGFKNRAEKVNLGVAAMDILYYFAEENMKLNKPFILENNFENTSKEKLVNLLERYNYTPITVLFNCDNEILYKRFIERDMSPSRHRGHVVNTQYPEVKKEEYVPMEFEDFGRKFHERGMDNFQIGDKLITVDTSDFNKVNFDEVIDEVQKYIYSCER